MRWLLLGSRIHDETDTRCCRLATTCSSVRPKERSSAFRARVRGSSSAATKSIPTPDGRCSSSARAVAVAPVHLSGEVDLRGRQEYFVPTKKADGAVNWLVLADANVDALVDEDEVTLDEDELKPRKRRSDDPDVVHRLRTARDAAGSARCDTAQCTGGRC